MMYIIQSKDQFEYRRPQNNANIDYSTRLQYNLSYRVREGNYKILVSGSYAHHSSLNPANCSRCLGNMLWWLYN